MCPCTLEFPVKPASWLREIGQHWWSGWELPCPICFQLHGRCVLFTVGLGRHFLTPLPFIFQFFYWVVEAYGGSESFSWDIFVIQLGDIFLLCGSNVQWEKNEQHAERRGKRGGGGCPKGTQSLSSCGVNSSLGTKVPSTFSIKVFWLRIVQVDFCLT